MTLTQTTFISSHIPLFMHLGFDFIKRLNLPLKKTNLVFYWFKGFDQFEQAWGIKATFKPKQQVIYPTLFVALARTHFSIALARTHISVDSRAKQPTSTASQIHPGWTYLSTQTLCRDASFKCFKIPKHSVSYLNHS